MAKKQKKFIAATGINYISVKTGEEVRVEAGEEVVGMNEVALGHEMEAGNVVEEGGETNATSSRE